jgi:hypothetical protein
MERDSTHGDERRFLEREVLREVTNKIDRDVDDLGMRREVLSRGGNAISQVKSEDPIAHAYDDTCATVPWAERLVQSMARLLKGLPETFGPCLVQDLPNQIGTAAGLLE